MATVDLTADSGDEDFAVSLALRSASYASIAGASAEVDCKDAVLTADEKARVDEIDLSIEHNERAIRALMEEQDSLASERNAILTAAKKRTTGKGSLTADPPFACRTFPWSDALEQSLHHVFGIQSFRPNQLEIINTTMLKKDVLVLMPTGGGKSLCYQLPATVSDGITIVISPLLSLMQDQIMQLRSVDVDAVAITSALSKAETNDVYRQMIECKTLKLVYATPERVAKSKTFVSKIEKLYRAGRLSRVVIDEVHCCSQWGHDFRPDYQQLAIFRRHFPDTPIIGLTATATSKVLADVKAILGIARCIEFRSPFNRPNLYYEVRQKPASSETQMEMIAGFILGNFPTSSGIVYCLSRKDAEVASVELHARGISCVFYHGDMEAGERERAHNMWSTNKARVVVATVAFGMGINKPDVRFVIHQTIAKSIENYYQETGRAGRDGLPAHCLMFFRPADMARQSSIVVSDQRGGMDNLHQMVKFCENFSDCRRALVARYFGETIRPDECNGMCDNCRRRQAGHEVAINRRNIADDAKNLVAMLNSCRENDKRITLQQLVDLWKGTGAKAKALRGDDATVAPSSLSRADCERIVVSLLVNGILKEDFHYTPYSTVCYIVPGPKGRHVPAQVVVQLVPEDTESFISSPIVASNGGRTVGQWKGVDSAVLATLVTCRERIAAAHNTFPHAVISEPEMGTLACLEGAITSDAVTNVVGAARGRKYGADILAALRDARAADTASAPLSGLVGNGKMPNVRAVTGGTAVCIDMDDRDASDDRGADDRGKGKKRRRKIESDDDFM